MIQLALTHTVDESPTVKTFYFTPERPLDYQPGQFTELYLPHSDADHKGERRWFTLSSSPTESHIAITTKMRATTPPSTFKSALWQLSPGQTVYASDPIGDFVLPLSPSIPLVWIAGGIGITPFRSHIAWLADNQEQRHIQFIHSTRNEDERIFKQYTERIPFASVHHVNTTASGRLDAPTILQLLASPGQYAASQSHAFNDTNNPAMFYIAGSETMVNDLVRDLVAAGVDRNAIVIDAFLGY